MHELRRLILWTAWSCAIVLLASPALRADIAGLLCFRSIGCMTGDGQDVCVDTDNDGVACEAGEPNLTMNAPTNAAGDETVQGNLIVVGSITETGVTYMHERILFDFSTASGNRPVSATPPGPLPEPDDCWPMRGDFVNPIAFAGSNPAPSGNAPEGRCRQQIAYDSYITRICGTVVDGVMPTAGSGCKVQFYTVNDRSTPLAVIEVRQSTGNLTALGTSHCVSINAGLNSPDTLYAQAVTASAECDADSWPEVYFQVLGYGVDIP